MEVIKVCESSEALQKARELLREIYATSNTGVFALDLSLCERLRWSAVSIVLSLADGQTGDDSARFCQFLDIARGAAEELLAALTTALDRRYLSESAFKVLCGKVDEIARMVNGCSDEVCGDDAAETEPPEQQPVILTRCIEANVVRPELFGWDRGYSEDTGMWGWKLKGCAHQN